jgi:hypothetical protein
MNTGVALAWEVEYTSVEKRVVNIESDMGHVRATLDDVKSAVKSLRSEVQGVRTVLFLQKGCREGIRIDKDRNGERREKLIASQSRKLHCIGGLVPLPGHATKPPLRRPAPQTMTHERLPIIPREPLCLRISIATLHLLLLTVERLAVGARAGC